MLSEQKKRGCPFLLILWGHTDHLFVLSFLSSETLARFSQLFALVVYCVSSASPLAFRHFKDYSLNTSLQYWGAYVHFLLNPNLKCLACYGLAFFISLLFFESLCSHNCRLEHKRPTKAYSQTNRTVSKHNHYRYVFNILFIFLLIIILSFSH